MQASKLFVCMYVFMCLYMQDMPVQPQSLQVRSQTVYYDFRLPLLCTVCLHHGRFVPVKNLEHPLNPSASQNHLSTLATPRHAPVLGCFLGRGFYNKNKTISQAQKCVESLEFLECFLLCFNYSYQAYHSHMKAGVTNLTPPTADVLLVVVPGCARCHMTLNGQFWQSEGSYLGTVRNMLCCALVYPRHHFAKARHPTAKHLSWH